MRLQTRWILISSAAAAVSVTLLLGLRSGDGQPALFPKVRGELRASRAAGSGCISNTSPTFPHHITDVPRITRVTPPGVGKGSDYKTHSYIFTPGGAPIYAPVDSTLIASTYYRQDGRNQYNVTFQVSCEVTYWIDHITNPVPRIRALLTYSKPRNTTGNVPPLRGTAFFRGGELIGTTSVPHTWDFGVYNEARPHRVPLPAAAAIHHRNRIANCPYDYFPPALRRAYQAHYQDTESGPHYPRTFCRP